MIIGITNIFNWSTFYLITRISNHKFLKLKVMSSENLCDLINSQKPEYIEFTVILKI